MLEVFVLKPRTLITRDELIEQVWQQGYVDDNAINRAISELRKTLKQHCNVTDLLKTHYKKGYSLQVDVEHFDVPSEPVDDNKADYSVNENHNVGLYQTDNQNQPSLENDSYSSEIPTNAKANQSFDQFKIPLFVLMLCIGLAFTILQFQSNELPENTDETVAIQTKAITWLKGQTVYPTMQRNGDLLAFGYREKATDNWQLIIKNLKNDTRSLINEQKTDFFPLSWHNQTLLYQKTSGEISEIWSLEYEEEVVNHKKLVSLPRIKYSSAAFSLDKSELFFIQENSLREPSLVKAVSLKSGEDYSLSTPRPGSAGDYFLRRSPDGSKLAVLRTDNWKKSQIYIIDLVSESTRRIYESETMLYSVVWQSDNNSLLFMKSPGALYKIDTSTQAIKKQKLSFNKPIEYLALYKENELLVTSDSMFYQDIFYKSSCQYGPNNKVKSDKAVVNSSYSDFFPTFKKQLAFVSNRTGSNQIWLRKENEQETLVSNFENVGKLSFLSWSNDGQNILGMAGNKIFILNLKSKHVKYLMLDGEIISSPTWSTDGRYVYYAKTHNSKWNIWQYDLTNDLSQQLSFTGGVSPKVFDQRGLVFLSESGSKLKIIDSNNEEKILLDKLNIIDTTAWTIADNNLFFSLRGKIVALDIETRERTECHSLIGFANHFSADNSGGFFYTLMADNQTNILSIQLPEM
ncbi:transcriptional regulator [Thalassotalea marina]|uniref:Transcriptional regulator n=1 Tax=Thalassotalea marina TaxID=1673741 RepID=A0A919BDD8_9GAMM|nr:transcriptional regulator [Thalassotalea marina]